MAKKLYMRYKLRVNKYGGRQVVVCGILGEGHLPWDLSLLVLGGMFRWRISRSECVTCVALEIRRIDVLLLVLVLLRCWTLHAALARSCIVPGDHCRIGVLSVAIVTVVMNSTRGTNTVLCCMWESLFK